MQSVESHRQRALADLTARARIRDAALEHFAERGMDGATVRGIAATAGVSPGLVQHHFGSKEKLRAACDAYVLERLRDEARQALDERQVGDPAFIEAAYASAPRLTQYLTRSLVDGSPAAAALFDALVQLTERYLSRTGDTGSGSNLTDVRAQAAVLTAMKLGVSVFQGYLMRTLGVRDEARDGYPRIARAMLDIVSPRFVDPDLAAQARAGLDRYQQEPPGGPPPRRPGGAP